MRAPIILPTTTPAGPPLNPMAPPTIIPPNAPAPEPLFILPVFDEVGYAYEHSDVAEGNFSKPYGWRCQYPDGLKLGNNVDIGCFTYINARYGVFIGDNVKIGSHCSIYSHDTERSMTGNVVIGSLIIKFQGGNTNTNTISILTTPNLPNHTPSPNHTI